MKKNIFLVLLLLIVAIISILFLHKNKNKNDTPPINFITKMIVDSSRFKIENGDVIDSLYNDYELFLNGKITDSNTCNQYKTASVYRLFYEKEKIMKGYKALQQKLHLPPKSRIVEVEYLAEKGIPNRAIILWMTNITFEISPDDLYCCPDVASGKCFINGIVNFSLVDITKMKIINTESLEEWVEYNEVDSTQKTKTIKSELVCFNMPLVIANPKFKEEVGGLTYHTIGGNETDDGLAKILFLDDYNGDGKALEWAVYQQYSCVNKCSALLGYSIKQDCVVKYAVHYKVYSTDENTNRDTCREQTYFWVDHEFCYKINPVTHAIQFTMDYRGRMGALERRQLFYSTSSETFYGTLDERIKPEDSHRSTSWYSTPLLH